MDTLPDETETSLLPSSPPQSINVDPTMSTIIKNSTIPVNVDDLGSGLIVVTFTHPSGTLYQGVLLQLNRERGIPCGISFPKNYCSTIPANSTDFEDENEQPPVQQRHTYFHISPNSTSPTPLRRFNRATKPPARYKNGKLALRLRHRPVLCSKCKAYCDERNPPKNLKEPPLQNGHINEVEEEDCKYFVAGPKTGLVENYWKRPVPPPPTNEQVGDSGEKINAINDLEQGLDTSRLILKSSQNNQGPSSILINQSADDKPPPDLLQTKKQNLRLCISKLQLQKQSAQEEKIEEIDSLTGTESAGGRRSSRRDPNPVLDNSRKRNTTVPARFRDEGCITTKKVFDFKRRRQGSKDSTALVYKSLPPLTTTSSAPIPQHSPSLPHSTICDDAAGVNVGKSTAVTVNVGKSSAVTVNVGKSTSSALPPLLIPRKSLSLLPKSEVTSRTPTIKISYGSSGQGVVIQIPSKPTVEPNPENPISGAEKSKAEKKALRKARKQAKRKLCMGADDCGTRGSALSNSFDLSSSQSSCSSPPPPLLTPVSELCPLIIDEDYPTTLDQCPPLVHFTKEIPTTPKKRKKQKKQKKYKQELLPIVS